MYIHDGFFRTQKIEHNIWVATVVSSMLDLYNKLLNEGMVHFCKSTKHYEGKVTYIYTENIAWF